MLKPSPDRWPEGEKNPNYKADLKDAAEHPERWGADHVGQTEKVHVPPKAAVAPKIPKETKY